MATALAVISVIGAAAGAVEQRKVSKAQKKQNRLNNRVAAIQRRRGVKRQIAQSRIQVAQAQSQGFQLGVSGGSAVQGATSGILSDTASTIGASNLQADASGFNAGFQNDISNAQQTAGIFSAISGIAGGLAVNEKGTAAIENFLGI